MVKSVPGGTRTVKAYHGSTERIARDPEVDMVAVAVRTPAHVDVSFANFQGEGKDLFVEWPVGSGLGATRKIVEVVRKSGVKTLVGCQTRQAGYVRKVKEIVDSGILGRILATSVIVSSYYPGVRGPTTFTQVSYAMDAANGATMLDIDGGHLIDVLQYLFGDIAFVNAHVATQYSTVQPIDYTTGKPAGEPIPQSDTHQVVLGISDATVLSVNIRNVLTEHGAGMFWVIDGEKGTLKIVADGMKGPSFLLAQPEVWVNGEKFDVEEDGEKERIAKNWERFADGKEGEYATVEDALKVKKVIEAVFVSGREGRRVSVEEV
ncbi:transcription regulator gal80 [Paramarasmius palmivorus]|uniref:Transcription regulator gal80 n=1 Tax=Paramarasmius palmivorus TaxID=297713 RepID=A0AAW0BMG8_9AGAR